METKQIGPLVELLGQTVPYEERGRRLHREIRSLLAALWRHERLGPDGPLMVLLFGGANTGKSSLFNALSARELSIGHAIAGSTRHVLTHASAAVCKELSDERLWPEPYRPYPLERREQIEEDISPRRVYLAPREITSGADAILMDSPDITTAHQENARLSGQMLLLADVVLLVLTEEQHADKVLVDHFPLIRDLAKHAVCVFNRVSPGKPEELGAYLKFRTIWMENRMGGMPERFFIPRLAPVRIFSQLQNQPAFQALRDHLIKLDRRDLRDQTQTGLKVALKDRGRELVEHLGRERQRVSSALEDLRTRYRNMVREYNSRRRWANRLLQVRSWLQSTIGKVNPVATEAEAQAAELKQRKFWQMFLTPLMGQDDRPSALEGLELLGDALESDPAPAPMFRPFSKIASGFSHLVFGAPLAGRADDPPSLIDALELLEKSRCSFVAHEVMPRSLGSDWQNAFPGSSELSVEPRQELDRLAQEYRDICTRLKTEIQEIVKKDPGVRERLSKRHARLALTAGITAALALIDMGHSALALGVGLGAPVLWELMDWAASQPELNSALHAFEYRKAMWMQRAFNRHVTGPMVDRLAELETRLDPEPLKMALRHAGMEL